MTQRSTHTDRLWTWLPIAIGMLGVPGVGRIAPRHDRPAPSLATCSAAQPARRVVDDPVSNNAILDLGAQLPRLTGAGSPVRGMAIGDGFIVVGRDRTGELQLVDASSGRVRWTWKAPNWVHSNPRIVGDMVIVGYGDSTPGVEHSHGLVRVTSGAGPGGVAAIDLRTGRVRWRFDAGGSVMTSPVVVDSAVYALTGRAELVALDLRDGAVLGRTTLPGIASMSNPHYADGALYFGFSGRAGLAAFDLDAGTIRWTAPLDSTPIGVGDVTPAIIGREIITTGSTFVTREAFMQPAAFRYIAARVAMKLGVRPYRMLGEQFVIAVDLCTGKPRWKRSLGLGWQADENRSGMPVALGDAIFISSVITNSVSRLDRNGTVVWTRPLEMLAIGGVIATRDGIIVAQRNGTILVLEPRTGAVRRSVAGPPIRAFAARLTDRALVVARADGTVDQLDRGALLGSR